MHYLVSFKAAVPDPISPALLLLKNTSISMHIYVVSSDSCTENPCWQKLGGSVWGYHGKLRNGKEQHSECLRWRSAVDRHLPQFGWTQKSQHVIKWSCTFYCVPIVWKTTVTIIKLNYAGVQPFKLISQGCINEVAPILRTVNTVIFNRLGF